MFAFDSLGQIGYIGYPEGMPSISKLEFERLCAGIAEDREIIIKHNPIGTDNEVLLWMLLNCLSSYLSLSDQEMPCFTDRPDVTTYREAILFVLRGRAEGGFEPGTYIDKLLKK